MKELYQDSLKQHFSEPFGHQHPITATHRHEGYNASCGDEITLFLEIDETGSKINNTSFESDCCAICKASASILCKSIKGKTIDHLTLSYDKLSDIFSGKDQQSNEGFEQQELDLLLPVKKHISRINCALLPWQTAMQACKSPIEKLSLSNQSS